MKTKIFTACVLAVLSAVMLVAAFGFIRTSPEMKEENLTVVTAPEQEKAAKPEFSETKEPFVSPEIEGENVALTGTASSEGNTGVYQATRAIDGKTDGPSYWEGKPNEYPASLTVELAEKRTVHAIRVKLNPDSIWGPREQTFSVLAGDSADKLEEIVPSAVYSFDPETGNEVIIELDSVEASVFALVFTENTGATSGQVAEFEIYAK